jgi:hypothetical protein
MRVNVYAEEQTMRLELINKGEFVGIRFYLELPVTVAQSQGGVMQYRGPFQHHEGDDDSSAVTFWGKKDAGEMFRKALGLLDAYYSDKEFGQPHYGHAEES